MLDLEFDTEFEELVESDFEYDGESWDEAAPRKGRSFKQRPGLKLPPRGNAVPKRPGSGVATKAELEATAKRLDDRIHTTAAAVKTIETRSRGVEREVGTMGSALRKEIALRKKETADLKKGLDESRQIAMIMPLLGGGDDKFSKMLPVLLYGGMLGGSSGSSTDSNNSMMMTMMMVLALQDD
jgi:hypothetical protein